MNTESKDIVVAFFDVDGTLTEDHTWKAYMAAFRAFGLKRRVHQRFLALHYPLYLLRKLGLVTEERFRTLWAAHLAWYASGFTPEELEPVWRWGVETVLGRWWRHEMLARVRQHRAEGHRIVLVSSAPEGFLQAVADTLEADEAVGTRFALADGRFTKEVVPPVCIGQHKATLTQQRLAERGWRVDYDASYAYADSITDLALLEMVGHPTAVHPDAALRRMALRRGWPILPAITNNAPLSS